MENQKNIKEKLAELEQRIARMEENWGHVGIPQIERPRTMPLNFASMMKRFQGSLKSVLPFSYLIKKQTLKEDGILSESIRIPSFIQIDSIAKVTIKTQENGEEELRKASYPAYIERLEMGPIFASQQAVLNELLKKQEEIIREEIKKNINK